VLCSVLALTSSCGKTPSEVERIIEEGVEVILNPVQPIQLPGQPHSLSLKKEYSIDTETEAAAAIGVGDITAFTVDEAGNIYLLSSKSSENFIHKFDPQGSHILSFAPKGQGPGELILPSHLAAGSQGIAVTDSRTKLVLYSASGKLLNEHRIPSSVSHVYPLNNGGFLVFDQATDPTDQSMVLSLKLLDSAWNEVKQLDSFQYPNPYAAPRVPAINLFFVWSVSPQRIYIAKEKRGYEIQVFDHSGAMLRKIRKEFKGIPILTSYKDEVVQSWQQRLREKLYFPSHFPPLQGLYAGADDRLYVMTYEQGGDPGEHVFDVFNPEGVFMARTSIPVRIELGLLPAAAAGGRMYCIRVKAGGHRELVVYRMIWD
jgi:hypothetical protein